MILTHNQPKSNSLMDYLGGREGGSIQRATEGSIGAADSFETMFQTMLKNKEMMQYNRDMPQINKMEQNLPEYKQMENQEQPRREESDYTKSDYSTVSENKPKEAKKTEDTSTKVKNQKADDAQSAKKTEKKEDKAADEVTTIESQLKSLHVLLEKYKNSDAKDIKLKEELTLQIKELLTKMQSTLNKLFDTNKDLFSVSDKKMISSLMEKLKSMLKNSTDTKDEKNFIAQLNSLKDDLTKEIKNFKKSEAYSAIVQNSTNKEHIKVDTADKSTLASVKTTDDAPKNEASNQNSNFSFSENENNSKFNSALTKTISHNGKAHTLFKEQVADLISKSRMVIKDSQNGSITLKMYPERLGNVSVNLGLENGTLSGKFFVESQEAKDALLANMSELRERLEEEGIELSSFEVNVKDQNPGFNRGEADNELYYVTPLSDESIANSTYENGSYTGYSHNGSLNMVI
jgi:flagellar hook-length control protein FliK